MDWINAENRFTQIQLEMISKAFHYTNANPDDDKMKNAFRFSSSGNSIKIDKSLLSRSMLFQTVNAFTFQYARK